MAGVAASPALSQQRPALRAPTVLPGGAGIVGQIVDRQSRTPIGGARIALLGQQGSLVSDSAGQFNARGLPSGNYVVQARAIGYAGASWIVEVRDSEIVTRVFELEPQPYTLDPLVVARQPGLAEQRRQDFERRRASGRGYFLTEAQIESAHPHTLGDLFRDVPGVRMTCRGSTSCSIRMARAPRECKPDFVLDGFPATRSTGLEMSAVGIVGIEIYRTLSETPMEFLKSDNLCGTIVIWTRSGPRDR